MMIEIKKLSYTYPDGTRALDRIQIRIDPGEALGIVGSNGAGKSTLLLHLNGILQGEGEIYVDGLKISDRNIPRIRSLVGLVFQDPEDQLFMPTVNEDVAFGPMNMGMSGPELDAAVDRALAAVDMTGFSSRSSHHLSLGERKRIAIATVLAMNPRILVLDEPSSNLDPKRRRELIAFLNALRMTKIIASHDLELVSKTCSRVIWMEEGRIIADGNREEVLSRFAEH